MCGRMNVIADPLCQWVGETLGLDFHTSDNVDLRPTQAVATVVHQQGSLKQLDTTWGIKPAWAKNILINAQAETVMQKPTFKLAFAEHRCLVPCSGWYEWRQEGTNEKTRKVRYLFSAADNKPLLMAGLIINEPTGAKLVTLTTAPISSCAPYHNRMPLFVDVPNVDFWFGSTPEQLQPLLYNEQGLGIKIELQR
ncbi:SOS response-associated peptidase [Shewanella litorisediminis]|uniref:Abasic site processing protein n=2 Tax=Shewanella litorisediminis TaxID=1173586 RepID=A0ABX7G4D7_9GAMM|nr:SOS response-associated peptidase [Shewanella litorisediminis]